ncbi:hypothetical protein WJ969_30080 [Achromobacter xylosoxidans]
MWPEITSGTPAVTPARSASCSQACVAARSAAQVNAPCASTTAMASSAMAVSAKS